MTARLLIALGLASACLLAGCAQEMAMTEDSPGWPGDEPRVEAATEPRIVPIPLIPTALRGCWETGGPEDPEEPGAPHRLIVTATSVEQRFDGEPGKVATAEYVQRVAPNLIEGLFSAPHGGHRDTVATSLSLIDDDTLRRAEGDAGSDHYSRCAD